MDVRIGVTYTPKEIDVEMGEDTDSDAVRKQVEEALAGDNGVLWLTDRKGKRVGVPAGKIAYIEIDSGADERRVGFGVHR